MLSFVICIFLAPPSEHQQTREPTTWAIIFILALYSLLYTYLNTFLNAVELGFSWDSSVYIYST